MCFAWISSSSAIFLGLIAYWQNERFKLENDKSSEQTEEKNEKYQNQLISINDRIMKLEENREYAYIAFVQGETLVVNINTEIKGEGKKYSAIIKNHEEEPFDKGTIFCFYITNQTDVPIRNFQIIRLGTSYCDYEQNQKDISIINYGKGGFVPSPIINKGEEVTYMLVAHELHDLAENVPNDMEISIFLDMEITSIYGRTVIQKFLLRLQKTNIFFETDNKNLFWNYCFETEPEKLSGSMV